MFVLLKAETAVGSCRLGAVDDSVFFAVTTVVTVSFAALGSVAAFVVVTTVDAVSFAALESVAVLVVVTAFDAVSFVAFGSVAVVAADEGTAVALGTTGVKVAGTEEGAGLEDVVVPEAVAEVLETITLVVFDAGEADGLAEAT